MISMQYSYIRLPAVMNLACLAGRHCAACIMCCCLQYLIKIWQQDFIFAGVLQTAEAVASEKGLADSEADEQTVKPNPLRKTDNRTIKAVDTLGATALARGESPSFRKHPLRSTTSLQGTPHSFNLVKQMSRDLQ